jgi:hypothetical protein
LDNGTASIAGVLVYNNANPYNFSNNFTQRDITLGSGSRVVGHDGAGNATINIAASCKPYQNPISSFSTNISLPRIPKVPGAPNGVAVDSATSSSLRYLFSGTTDGGSAITGWEAQLADNPSFSNPTTAASNGNTTFNNLNPAVTYYFRSRGFNAIGAGPYSGTSSGATLAAAPFAPTITGITNVTPTTARINGTIPNNQGSAISSYVFQAATNSSFTTGVITQSHVGHIYDITGLVPGQTYFFRMYAVNAVGSSPWSNTASAYVGLPAPAMSTWTQNSTGGLVATWTAPNPATALTGYRLQIATNEGFSANVQNVDLGNVLTGTVTGLAGGRQYWARVAAVTAGGVNAFSGSLEALLVLAAGDLNGWTRVGVKPAAISYFTNEGIRRGVSGINQALFLESLSAGAVTLAADTFGLQRTMTTISGKAYRLQASITGSFPSAPTASQGTTYRFAVGATLGTTATLPSATGTVALPPMQFVATATTTVIRILLGSAVTVPGAQNDVERVAIHSIRMLEIDTDFPQRLRETVYESNLANHFDLACNSVGASWYVGRDGLTRFSLPGEALPVSTVFSDEDGVGVLNYVDVSAAYDTKSMVNRIEATNFGMDSARVNELNELLTVADDVSIAAYGVRSENLDLNLWLGAPYAASVTARLADLLNDYAEPALLISSLRWNAQQNPAAAQALEVGQRISVRYRGTTYDNQIVAISHDITPTRWMVTLELRVL